MLESGNVQSKIVIKLLPEELMNYPPHPQLLLKPPWTD